MKENQIVLEGPRRNSLYYLKAQPLVGQSKSSTKDDSRLWHIRLGHLGEKGMNKLIIDQDAIHHSSKFSIKP